MSRLPKAIQDFVRQQVTVSLADVWKRNADAQYSRYATYWCKAAACMLLSGRIHPKAEGGPNMTDATRVCKEANFNQYLLKHVAEFLIAAQVIQATRGGEYEKGPTFAMFWRHEGSDFRQAVQKAVLKLVADQTGFQPWRPTLVWQSGLIDFLALFFACFRGKAFGEAEIGKLFLGFSKLPEGDLCRAAKMLKVKVDRLHVGGWRHWLDEKGQKALVAALYAAEWAYCVEQKQRRWFFPSLIGLGILGLADIPPIEQLPTDLRVLSNHDILAGAGLEMDRLASFFRYCRIKRIAPVFEFQLEPRRLAQTSAKESPGEQLLKALKGLEPLPSTVSVLLGMKSKMGGLVGIRECSALVKPERPETLTAIREHPRLKGYLEPGAPPGYLLIKANSNPANFVQRCQELGFDVRSL
jgi:hypothetical protein